MSSMPPRDEPGQWGSTQSAGPGEWNEPGTQQGTMPGQQGHGQAPGSGIPGQPGSYQGQQGEQGYGYEGQQDPYQGRAQQYGGRPGSVSPVNEAETRVTGRRVVQYLIDAFLVSIIPSLVSIPFDRSNSTSHPHHRRNRRLRAVRPDRHLVLGDQAALAPRADLRDAAARPAGDQQGRRPGQHDPAVHPLDLPDLRRHPVLVAVHRPGRVRRDPVLAAPAADR